MPDWWRWPDAMTDATGFSIERQLEALSRHGVDFVVVGGIAATLLGTSRDTFDLDVCPSQDPANLDALGEALIELQAKLRGVEESVPFVPDGRTLSNMRIITLDTSAGPLDILMRPDGCPPYERLRANAERKELGGFSVLVASIDDLIAMRRSADRLKDQLVVEELEAIRKLRGRLGIAE